MLGRRGLSCRLPAAAAPRGHASSRGGGAAERPAARGGDARRPRPGPERAEAARHDAGADRGADSRARRRLPQAPARRHRRPRVGGPGAGGDRRAGAGPADPPGRGRDRAGPGRGGAGAGEPRAGEGEPRAGAHHGGPHEELVEKGISPQQEGDQYQAQLAAQDANVQALEKAILAQRSNLAAVKANLRAPAGGAGLPHRQGAVRRRRSRVRNVDVGALVSTGTHAALPDRADRHAAHLRQRSAGQRERGARRPAGDADRVASSRAARSAEPSRAPRTRSIPPAARCSSRWTCRTQTARCFPEPTPTWILRGARPNPPLVVPAAAILFRTDGAQVAVVQPDQTVHLQKITVGRDYGDRVEILQGIAEGTTIVAVARRRRARGREDRARGPRRIVAAGGSVDARQSDTAAVHPRLFVRVDAVTRSSEPLRPSRPVRRLLEGSRRLSAEHVRHAHRRRCRRCASTGRAISIRRRLKRTRSAGAALLEKNLHLFRNFEHLHWVVTVPVGEGRGDRQLEGRRPRRRPATAAGLGIAGNCIFVGHANGAGVRHAINIFKIQPDPGEAAAGAGRRDPGQGRRQSGLRRSRAAIAGLQDVDAARTATSSCATAAATTRGRMEAYRIDMNTCLPQAHERADRLPLAVARVLPLARSGQCQSRPRLHDELDRRPARIRNIPA